MPLYLLLFYKYYYKHSNNKYDCNNCDNINRDNCDDINYDDINNKYNDGVDEIDDNYNDNHKSFI